MDKIPILKPSEAIKILEKMGFLFLRSKGSHRIFVKGNKRVTVPYHNKDLRKGTLKEIIKQSGLSLNDFKN